MARQAGKSKDLVNGATPFVQGYWARVEGRPIGDWPKWSNWVLSEEWKSEWIRGWQERKNEEKARENS